MALMLGALYEALRRTADDDVARKAAEEVAGYESRLSSMESRLSTMDTKLNVITGLILLVLGLLLRTLLPA